MVQRKIIVLEDDIDGGNATETVSFSLDGRHYTIDLNEANAKRMRESFRPWLTAARRAGKPALGNRPVSDARREKVSKMRQWGRDNGWDIGNRGRVPRDLEEAYDQRHRERGSS